MGKCPDCGSWDSLEEAVSDPGMEKDPHRALAVAWAGLADGEAPGGPAPAARPIAEIESGGANVERLPTGLFEFDRTLGGSGANSGLVPGGAVLLGGEPGIGKSTLLIQAAMGWAARGVRTLYVSSEESAEQVAMRASRVAGRGADESLFVLHDTNLARILEQVRRVQPRVLIVDSVQMIYRGDLPGAPGSVTQLRRCAAELVTLAKAGGIGVLLVGHVTKDGRLAGPRLLEHMVDTVLSFEGDRAHSYRVVRAVKNRYGSTLELGLFEMGGGGLRPVEEGGVVSAIATQRARVGCVLCPIISGTRCLMVEAQALTATGFLGAAKRKCSGLDPNRMAMVIAVLEQHAGLRLADRDIFASSVGGVRVLDPGADLAILLAIGGAHYHKTLPPRTCAIGEVGLSGEVRATPHLEQRVREAARLGMARIIAPAGKSLREIAALAPGAQVVGVPTVDRALEELEGGPSS